MKYVIIIKIVTTSMVWLFTLPFFYRALKDGNPDRFREYLNDLPNLTVLTLHQLFDQLLFPYGLTWVLLVPGIWFAGYLVRRHLTSNAKTTDAFLK